jgi:hypothetical protein
MNQLQIQNVGKLQNLKRVHVVFNPKLAGTGGMDYPTNDRRYPKEYRHLPQELIDSLERIGSLDPESNLVIQSAGMVTKTIDVQYIPYLGQTVPYPGSRHH